MTCYRPTTLKLADNHCPKALDSYERGDFRFSEAFAVGVAAHDCLAAVGELAIASGRAPDAGEVVTTCQATMERLAAHGRRFEDTQEPPMRYEAATAGRDLSIAYATEHPLSPTAQYEQGVAFDRNWRRVGYNDPSRRFRLIYDVTEIVEDEGEEYTGRLAVHTDYKSAWSTNAGELATWQMRAQSVARWLTAGDVDGIRRQVVNLRTGQMFSEDLWLEAGGREQLEDWRRDLTRFMDILDAMNGEHGRPARPGAGCIGCPWALTCEDAGKVLAGSMLGGPLQLDDLLRGLAVADAVKAELTPLAKAATDETLYITGIGALGWHKFPESEPARAAATTAYELWTAKGGDLPGFLTALPMSMGAIRKLAKTMHREDETAQEAFVSQLSTMTTASRFGVRKGPK